VGGQHQRPRALKEILHLPLEYTGKSNSWVNRKIFKNWFFHIFVPSMEEYFRKVGMPEDTKFMLSLDNCNSHSCQFELQLGNICVLYLPSNVALLIQPMDQGVVQNMKCYYRRDFLLKLVNDEGIVTDFKRTRIVRESVFSVACAWNSVKAKLCAKPEGDCDQR